MLAVSNRPGKNSLTVYVVDLFISSELWHTGLQGSCAGILCTEMFEHPNMGERSQLWFEGEARVQRS